MTLSVGIISFDDIEGSINVLGTLKLQNALGGGVEIDELGNVKVSGTLTVDSDIKTKAGIVLASEGEKPACDETGRGKIWFNKKEPTDLVEVCIKDSDNYLWQPIY